MEKLDKKILSFFTKISHGFQRLTGRTNFFLAKCSLILVAFGVLTGLANYYFPNLLAYEAGLYLAIMKILSISVLALWYFPECDKAEAASLCSGTAKFFSSLIFNYKWRLFGLFLALLEVGISLPLSINSPKGVIFFKVLDDVSSTAFLSFLYFAAVDPLPPCKSKIKKWLESFSVGLQKPASAKRPL